MLPFLRNRNIYSRWHTHGEVAGGAGNPCLAIKISGWLDLESFIPLTTNKIGVYIGASVGFNSDYVLYFNYLYRVFSRAYRSGLKN